MSNSVYIGLLNPKSPSNVGSVLRAVGCYQASAVRYTGERFDRAVKYHTDTKNAQDKTPLTHTKNLLADLPTNMQVVCVELVEGAEPLPNFVHPDNALYVFGPEDKSLTQDIVDQADHVVFIPTKGCMNLAATVNVVLYDRLSKTDQRVDADSLIKQSRDAKNRLRVDVDKTD